jgi:hypothetical protein
MFLGMVGLRSSHHCILFDLAPFHISLDNASGEISFLVEGWICQISRLQRCLCWKTLRTLVSNHAPKNGYVVKTLISERSFWGCNIIFSSWKLTGDGNEGVTSSYFKKLSYKRRIWGLWRTQCVILNQQAIIMKTSGSSF